MPRHVVAQDDVFFMLSDEEEDRRRREREGAAAIEMAPSPVMPPEWESPALPEIEVPSVEDATRRMRERSRRTRQTREELTAAHVGAPTPFGDEPSEEERTRRRREIASMIEPPPVTIRGGGRRSEDLTGSEIALMASQGASFGFSDEAAAALRAPFSDQSYREIWQEYQGAINEARDVSPYGSFGLEILGGLGPGIVGAGRAIGRGLIARGGRWADDLIRGAFEGIPGLRSAAPAAAEAAPQAAQTFAQRAAQLGRASGRSAGYGGAGSALYGAGASQETEAGGIAQDAAISGVAGAVLGGVIPPGVAAARGGYDVARSIPRVGREILDEGSLGPLVPPTWRQAYHRSQARRGAPQEAAEMVEEMTRAAPEPVDVGRMMGPYRTAATETAGVSAGEMRRRGVHALTPGRVDEMAREMGAGLNEVFAGGELAREVAGITRKPALVRRMMEESPPPDISRAVTAAIDFLEGAQGMVTRMDQLGRRSGRGGPEVARLQAAIDTAVQDISGIPFGSRVRIPRSTELTGGTRAERTAARRRAQLHAAEGIDFDQVRWWASQGDPGESGRAASAYGALDQLKRQLGAIAARNTPGRSATADPWLHAVTSGLSGGADDTTARFGQEQLRRFMMDAEVWGPLATSTQREVNEVLTDMITTQRALERLFAMSESGMRSEANPYRAATRANMPSLANLIRNMGRAETTETMRILRHGVANRDRATRVLAEHYNVGEEMAEALRSSAAGARTMDRLIPEIQRYREAALLLDEIGQRARAASTGGAERMPGEPRAAAQARSAFGGGNPVDHIRALQRLDDSAARSAPVWGEYAAAAAEAQAQGVGATAALFARIVVENPGRAADIAEEVGVEYRDNDGDEVEDFDAFFESVTTQGEAGGEDATESETFDQTFDRIMRR